MRDISGIPIIHFSCHGNKEGIGLTSGEFVSWDALKGLLSPINKALEGALVICMSSCSGFSGCEMAMSEDGDLPFYGLIGHTETPVWSDAAVAFVTFYHRFFKGTPVVEAVKAMRTASGDDLFREVLANDVREAWIKIVNRNRQKEAEERLRQAIEST